MKKTIYYLTLLTVFVFNSCKKNINQDTEPEESNQTLTDFRRIIDNSEKFEFTRVLICRDDFDEIYHHPDLPIILEGKLDKTENVFIEINRRISKSKFSFIENQLVVENESPWLEKDKTYKYDIYIRENHVILLDDSIDPKPGRNGITSCTRNGFVIYTKDFDENSEYYYKTINESFKN